ncbi:hypothetical protein D3C71_1229580 [compost metagenome]
MPEPRGRRHPLFLRLTKSIDPIYPDAVTPVAWDDDEALEEVEGVVYIVTRQCARMRAWARQLRALHQADETYKTEEGISPLSAAPLREPDSMFPIELWVTPASSASRTWLQPIAHLDL